MLFVYEKEAEGGGSDYVVVSAPDAARAAIIGAADGMIGGVVVFDSEWLEEYYGGSTTLSTGGF